MACGGFQSVKYPSEPAIWIGTEAFVKLDAGFKIAGIFVLFSFKVLLVI
jgi:hypothetical protein